MDPDPRGSAWIRIHFPFLIRIRIQLADPGGKFKKKNKKKCKEIGNNCNFIQIFNVKFALALFFKSSLYFSYTENSFLKFLNWIWIRIRILKAAVSGSALKKFTESTALVCKYGGTPRHACHSLDSRPFYSNVLVICYPGPV